MSMTANRTCAANTFSQDVLLLLAVKIVTDLDLAFGSFVDGEKPETSTVPHGLGDLKLVEHSLCSHYPFHLNVSIREGAGAPVQSTFKKSPESLSEKYSIKSPKIERWSVDSTIDD